MAELKKQIKFKPTGNPEWEYKGAHKFESAFSRIIHKWYDATHFDRYSLEYPLGNLTDYPCAFCGRQSPEVSFKKTAHILPACIGNDIYFSKEECDSCNKRLGQAFDSEFGSMTSSIRGLFKYPTRNGRAEWDLGDGPTKVEFDPVKGLSITVGGENPPIRFEVDTDKKSATIFGPGYSFRPAPAILALVHSAWLFMSNEQRRRHQSLLSFLNDGIKIEPFNYFTGTEPGFHPHHVRFEVFERVIDDSSIPEVFIKLALGSYYFAWAAPDFVAKQFRPMPAIPFEMTDELHLPTMTLHGIKEHDALIKGGVSRFAVSFAGSEYVEGHPQVSPPAKPPLKSIPVRIRVSGSTCIEMVGVYLRLLNLRSSDPHFVVSGPKFFTNFEVPFEGNLKKAVSFHMKFRYWGQPAEDVLRTLRLLDAICQPSATIEILGPGDQLIMSMSTPEKGQSFSLDLALKVAQLLVELGEALGKGFYFPKEIDDNDLDALYLLHNTLVRKNVPDEKGTCSFKINSLDAGAFKKMREGSGDLGLGLPQREVELFGQRVVVPAHQRIMSNYEVISPATSEELDAEGTLVIRYEGVRCQF